MGVAEAGPIRGKTVEDAGLRNLQGLFLAEIVRTDGRTIPATPYTELQGGDCLTFVGSVETVVELQNIKGLESTESEHFIDSASSKHTFYEAVVGPASRLNGSTIKEVGFRGRYEAAVVAVHRAGHRLEGKIGSVELRTGDTLLLVAEKGFRGKWRERSDFLLVAELGGVERVDLEELLSKGLAALDSGYLDIIPIKDAGRTIRVNASTIDWVDAAGDYMCIHAEGQTHIMRGTMKKLEEVLNPKRFQRIHRSTIVNIDRVREIRTHINGEYFLILDNDNELKMSRHYKDRIKHFVPEV